MDILLITWVCDIVHWLIGKYWFSELCVASKYRQTFHYIIKKFQFVNITIDLLKEICKCWEAVSLMVTNTSYPTLWFLFERSNFFVLVLYFIFNLFLNWRQIALQCCAEFYYTTMWVCHKYTYVPSHMNLSPTPCSSCRLSQRTRLCVSDYNWLNFIEQLREKRNHHNV